MKNILVISEYFAPLNSIASIRFTKILKYLSRKERYNFIVVARKSDDKHDALLQKELDKMKPFVTVHYVDIQDNIIDSLRKKKKELSKTEVNNQNSTNNAIKFKPYSEATFKEKIYKMLNTLKYIYNERIFEKRGMRYLESLDINFDSVISSYGDAGAHLLAIRFLKKHKNIPWIADHRDPVITYYRPPVFNGFFTKIEKETLKRAKVITGVNKASMGICANADKSKVIINGFDTEDIEDIDNTTLLLSKDKINICYTGRIYSGKSDASVLFKALKDLNDSGEIDMNYFSLNYAGNNFDLLYKQAEEYNLTNILVNHGYVQRQVALSIQKQSQILLVLSWNDDDEEDVLTGKFMEYLMAKKEILAIVMGNRTNSSIKRILDSSNVGFCFEEALGESGYLELKNYLIKIFYECKEQGTINYSGNQNVLAQYHYKNIADQFENLILLK